MSYSKPIQPQKPKTIGSMYINVPKNSPPEMKDELFDIFQTLQSMKAYFSISISDGRGGYVKFRGLPNQFKKDPKSQRTDSDFYVVRQEDNFQQSRGGYNSAPKQQNWQRRPAPAPAQDDDDIPSFG